MSTYNKPDLNAPRFRPKRHTVFNAKFYHEFIETHPKYKHLSFNDVKNLITGMNEMIWQTVVENRDGVEFPEQLGYVFIGSCKRKKSSNPDRVKSIFYGKKIQNRNWESDEYVAKIFYTNYETKYSFKNHIHWGFQGTRAFKRTVASTYPTDWKKYIVVDNLTQVSKIFRKHGVKEFISKRTDGFLESYDEFSFD